MADHPSASHLCQYLEESAARFPGRVAAVDPDGSSLTYAQLDQQASRIAGFLVSRGIRPGDRVGLVLPKSAEALAAVLGIMKARAAYVPVDWTGPVERVRTILTDCGVKAVFLDRRRQDLLDVGETTILLGPGEDDATGSAGEGKFAWTAVIAHEPFHGDVAERQPDDLAYILYTSGSTGIPKGVMLTHRNASSYVDWCSEVFSPTENDRFSSHAPFHFDLSILDIYVPLKHGASVHLIPEDLGKNPKDLARFIAGHQITVWYSTPAILGLLAEFGELDRLDCASLRLVLFAGEVFPVKQLRRTIERWPAPDYYNLYGPTETNVCTFALIPKPVPESRTEPYPIGWPCSHCTALLLDQEGLPAKAGEEGLLYIAGPSVFLGYWGRSAESAAVFLERDGARWYNTGDVVREQDGDGFIYVGRRDRMVKRRGYRIELGEVESCLYRHPEIAEAAVIAVPNPQTGTRIISYLVSAGDKQPSIIGMKSFCNQHLPAYMNPDIFVFVDSLPRTSTNKVDYQALIRRFQGADPGESHKVVNTLEVAPP
jgi:amino acid adenylation domain-containing protein